jgi:hypothetical protein
MPPSDPLNENVATGQKVTRWGVWTIRDLGTHKVFGFPTELAVSVSESPSERQDLEHNQELVADRASDELGGEKIQIPSRTQDTSL